MSLNKLKENLPILKSKGTWKLTWTRSSEDGYDALMYSNEKLSLTIRIDEKSPNEIMIKVWKDGNEIFRQVFPNSAQAIAFMKDYFVKNAGTESLITKHRFKESLKEATERGINHEYELLKSSTDEYLRVLNLLISNSDINPEIITKIKEVRDYLLKANLT